MDWSNIRKFFQGQKRAPLPRALKAFHPPPAATYSVYARSGNNGQWKHVGTITGNPGLISDVIFETMMTGQTRNAANTWTRITGPGGVDMTLQGKGNWTQP